MYHNVHVLILSDMYIHVHTCVHVHTYVVFICTYEYKYIYVCTHMYTLKHIPFFVCTYKSIQRVIFRMTNKSISCDTNEISRPLNSFYQTHKSILFYSPYLLDHVSKHSGVPPCHGIRYYGSTRHGR